jgi:creatinine amidohydrolase
MNEDAGPQTATAADLIREWKYLTGTDFQKMDRANTVVLVTCSPLEVHGPHLPVITDNLEAQKIAERAVELLHPQFPDRTFVHMPPIFVASDVLPHPGSVNFRSSTIVNVLEDLGRSLAAQGFVDIWVTSFHGGPRHFVPIEVAADNVNRRYGTRMVSVFSLMLARLTGGSSDLANFFAGVPGIRKEDLLGDHHGGAVETSLMLHLLGDKVQTYDALPRNVVPDVDHNGEKPTLFELLTGFKKKLKYYETSTYSGTPAVASAEAGAEMLERLAGAASEALGEVLRGELPESKWHSPIWKVRWLFMSRTVSWTFEKWARFRSQVW